MKKNTKWIICVVCFLIFLILGFLVLTEKDIYLDSFVYKFISGYISNDLTRNVKYLTSLASAIVVIIITVFTFIFFKNKKYGFFMVVDLIIITLFQFILKYSFARVRPVDINLIEESGYSFPSGHSLTAMAFYGLIIYFIHRSNLSKKSKIIYTILFSIIIFIVGLSRIYLGVHFFTDVLGGFAFSISFLIIYTNFIDSKLK